MYFGRTLVAVLAIGLVVKAGEPGDTSTVEWPQWRGPTRDGRYAGPPWPDRLDDQVLREKWRVDLAPSYSGPIVAADRVFVTETKDARVESVRALDRATGKELWSTEWEGAMRVPFFALSNGSWIRATPAYDGENLYVAGMRDVLVCLDAQDGKQKWRIDFVERFGTPLPAFGFVASPLIDGDSLYVQAGASVVKLDKNTGEIRWRGLEGEGGMNGSDFSSPTIATLGGVRQLLVQTRTALAGLDLDSGKVFWSKDIPAFRGMNILTPTVLGDSVFTSSYGGRSWSLKVAHENGEFKVEDAWTNPAQGYMSTPVVIDGHAYLHLRNKRFTCIDLATGESTWTTQPFGKYWSLVANGDRILALDQRGELLLIRATPAEFVQLDRREIADGETWAHLAVCGREVFVRELEGLAVYEWTEVEEGSIALDLAKALEDTEELR